MTAELTAIKEALIMAKQREVVNCVVITDSLSSCHLLMSNMTMKETDSLTREVLALAGETKAMVHWVPSHVGLDGNERADELARKGLESKETVNNDVMVKDAIGRLRKNMLEKTDQWYKRGLEHKGKTFGDFQGCFGTTPWFRQVRMSGVQTRMANRLITGHDFSPYWLAVMGKEGYIAECDECGTKNTSRHIFFECGKWRNLREKHGMGMYGSFAEVVRKQQTERFFDMMTEMDLRV
jgi:hypothetical protein